MKTTTKSTPKKHDLILKHCLKNAMDFGKVNSKFVLGHVLREQPELKKDVPGLLQQIESVATEIAPLSKSEIETQLQKLSPELLEEKGQRGCSGATPGVCLQLERDLGRSARPDRRQADAGEQRARRRLGVVDSRGSRRREAHGVFAGAARADRR